MDMRWAAGSFAQEAAVVADQLERSPSRSGFGTKTEVGAVLLERTLGVLGN